MTRHRYRLGEPMDTGGRVQFLVGQKYEETGNGAK